MSGLHKIGILYTRVDYSRLAMFETRLTMRPERGACENTTAYGAPASEAAMAASKDLESTLR